MQDSAVAEFEMSEYWYINPGFEEKVEDFFARKREPEVVLELEIPGKDFPCRTGQPCSLGHHPYILFGYMPSLPDSCTFLLVFEPSVSHSFLLSVLYNEGGCTIKSSFGWLLSLIRSRTCRRIRANSGLVRSLGLASGFSTISRMRPGRGVRTTILSER